MRTEVIIMQDIVANYNEKVCIDFVKVGKRIQEVRKKKKMTQAYLASICGCSNNHLSAIETGVNKPSIEMIMKISIALEKSIDYFLQDAPNASPSYIIDSEIAEKLKRCNIMSLQLVNSMLDGILDYQSKIEKV
ncbi:helix-turn-helix domain-containing protein [Clostridioides difficile]|nr:helix-turn-helix domain-containing protein [Clostridioides difficile]MDN9300368.1 helix-turn-helix domain-containing protein [Clostridioides difficile]